jgi:hypothetical protein
MLGHLSKLDMFQWVWGFEIQVSRLMLHGVWFPVGRNERWASTKTWHVSVSVCSKAHIAHAWAASKGATHLGLVAEITLGSCNCSAPYTTFKPAAVGTINGLWSSQKMNSQFIVHLVNIHQKVVTIHSTPGEHSSKSGTKWSMHCSIVSSSRTEPIKTITIFQNVKGIMSVGITRFAVWSGWWAYHVQQIQSTYQTSP